MTKSVNSDRVKSDVESHVVYSIGYGTFGYKIVDETDLNTGKVQRSHGVGVGAKVAVGLGVEGEIFYKIGGFDNTPIPIKQ